MTQGANYATKNWTPYSKVVLIFLKDSDVVTRKHDINDSLQNIITAIDKYTGTQPARVWNEPTTNRWGNTYDARDILLRWIRLS